MARYLTTSARRVLDVGCGSGGFGAYLKSINPLLQVVGIEPDEAAALRASDRLDAVEVGSFPATLPSGAFDIVFFNDVLEHLLDPAPALEKAHAISSLVVASIPNIRHIDVLRDLVLRGQWDYCDEGILDRTHMRFYTRSSIVTLFESANFEVLRVDAINLWSRNRRIQQALRWVRDHHFIPLQFAVVAAPRSQPAPQV